MIFCTSCGTQLDDNAAFCFNCGTPIAAAPAAPEAVPVNEPVEQVQEPEVVPAPPVQEPDPVPAPAPAPAPEAPQPQYQQPQYQQPQYQYQQPQYQYQQPQYQQPQQTTIINNIPTVPPEYKPIGAWAYFGWSILFGIPLVGLILLIVFSCGGTRNINLRNFARSHFCSLLVSAIVILIIVIFAAIIGASIYDWIEEFFYYYY